MSTTVKGASTKKTNGNKTTELIIGSSAAKLAVAVNGIQSALLEANKLNEIVAESSLKVVEMEDKLGALDQELVNKKAQNKYEIELSYKTDKKSFVEAYLSDNELMTVNETEWLAMQKKLEDSDRATTDAVSKAVGAATGSLKSEHTSALKVAQLEHDKKEAENVATIKQLTAQITFLTQQNQTLQTLIDTQIKAETERAKHQPAIHVNGTNTGR